MDAQTTSGRSLVGLTVALVLAGCAAGATSSPSAAPSPSVSPAAGRSDCAVATLAGKPGEEGAVDGVGAEARFSGELTYLAMDSAGVVFIIDTADHAILKMTPDGTVTTFAGKRGVAGTVDGVGTAARFNRPNELAFDAAGTMYLAQEGNDAIRRITPDGTVTTFADNIGFLPAGLAVDAAGNVYTSGWDGDVILKIAPDGTITTFAGMMDVPGTADGQGSAARFDGALVELKFDAQGVLWVVEWQEPGGRLRKVTPDGTVTTVRSDWDGFGTPGAIWIDLSGEMYSPSYFHNTVMRISPDGAVTALAGLWSQEDARTYADGPGDVARFAGPTGIVRDVSGLFYIADSENMVIRTMRCNP